MKLKYGRFELEFSKEEVESVVDFILLLEKKMNEGNVVVCTNKNLGEESENTVEGKSVDTIYEILTNNTLKPKLKEYILSKPHYEHSMRELMETFLGISGKFSELYGKDRIYTIAYDRLYDIVKEVRREIAEIEDGQWKSFPRVVEKYGRVQVFRFIRNGQDYFPQPESAVSNH